MNEYEGFGFRVRRKKPKRLQSFLTANDHKKNGGPYILLDYLVVYQFIAQTETKMFWQRAENGQDMIPILVMNKQTTQWQRTCSNNSAATAWCVCVDTATPESHAI
jgi:hypothetical protein